MCGISGIFDPFGTVSTQQNKSELFNLVDSQAHRGPDSIGSEIIEEDGIFFGHNRLAILELSKNGAQPMYSACRKWLICFNGEIYNHIELRAEYLDKFRFRGSSDTETVVELISKLGVRATLQNIRGMFAFAAWNINDKKLYLARDRSGEKPLIFGIIKRGAINNVVFASEMRGLIRNYRHLLSLDNDAISYYFNLKYIPAPYTPFNELMKLEPGHMLEISTNCEDFHFIKSQYNSAEFDQDYFCEQTDGDVANKLEQLLYNVLSEQLVADVPVGAFLSGGIDSSLITAIASKINPNINSFTIGFSSKEFNEAEYAKAVAQHLGTSHVEHYVTEQDLLNTINLIPEIYSEPFADSSQIPTLLVSQLARQHVTVALSGDAADELFGGYTRYSLALNYWQKLSSLPFAFRSLLKAPLLNALPLMGILGKSYAVLSNRSDTSKTLKAVQRGAELFDAQDFFEVYSNLIFDWRDAPNTELTKQLLYSQWSSLGEISDLKKMMTLDYEYYLPGDILSKVDTAAMRHSLETRAPFLDRRVVEFSSKLPDGLKINNGVGKVILRDLLRKYLPDHLFVRPKKGFGVPLNSWFQNELRDITFDTLGSDALDEIGLGQNSRHKLEKLHAGYHGYEHDIWTSFTYVKWHQTYMG